MDARRRDILAAALRARLADVAARPETGAAPRALPAPRPDADAEEALRRLMVSVVPRLAAGGADMEELCRLLAVVATAARLDDLRFLDAFHRVYELDADGLLRGALPAAFHQTYRRLLVASLEELDG
jgi:hypothetical protein